MIGTGSFPKALVGGKITGKSKAPTTNKIPKRAKRQPPITLTAKKRK